MTEVAPISIFPIAGLPEIQPGDPIEDLIADRVRATVGDVLPGDIIIVTHKIVSKAEGRLVELATVTPSPFAESFAAEFGKDPRQVEMVLREARRIVRMDRGHLIAETRHGFICANAGVDASNTAEDTVSLLPEDPDGSAERIRARLVAELPPGNGPHVGVVVTDSFGRPWRNGIVNVAIGVSGVSPIADYRGQFDTAGHELRSTVLAVADELASAAELVMHKTTAIPVALVRGYSWQVEAAPGSGRDLVMPAERDLFR